MATYITGESTRGPGSTRRFSLFELVVGSMYGPREIFSACGDGLGPRAISSELGVLVWYIPSDIPMPGRINAFLYLLAPKGSYAA